MPSLLPHDLCHGWSSSRRLLALLHTPDPLLHISDPLLYPPNPPPPLPQGLGFSVGSWGTTQRHLEVNAA